MVFYCTENINIPGTCVGFYAYFFRFIPFSFIYIGEPLNKLHWNNDMFWYRFEWGLTQFIAFQTLAIALTYFSCVSPLLPGY